MNVLLSSCGRRVSLMECFRQSLAELGLRGQVGGADCSPSAPARSYADFFEIVPRCGDAGFLASLREICRRQRAGLIVPTIDTELAVHAAARDALAAEGVTTAVSAPATVTLCNDKWQTCRWLTAHGFPSVSRTLLRDDFPLRRLEVPLVVKPRFGSASDGVRAVHHREELEWLARGEEPLVAEPWLRGEEYTVNVYVDRRGRCLCATPHRRVAVRAGEVSKAVTVKDQRLMRLARSVAEMLPGAYGPLNLQCFVLPDGRVLILEINARFGGGYPLTHQAGATFTRWLIEDALQPDKGRNRSYHDNWRENLAMLRHDREVFLPAEAVFPENDFVEDIAQPA